MLGREPKVPNAFLKKHNGVGGWGVIGIITGFVLFYGWFFGFGTLGAPSGAGRPKTIMGGLAVNGK